MTPELPPAQDVSPGAPIFFLHFAEEEAALQAAVALLHRGYRVEITPPRPDVAQWDVYAAGAPAGLAPEAAVELFREWSSSVGGTFSGGELTPDEGFGDEADDWGVVR